MGAQVGRHAVPNASHLMDPDCRLLTVPCESNADEVALLYCDADIECLLKETINKYWPNCVDKVILYAEHFCGFKLFGHPFSSNTGNSSARSMSVARFMCSFIEGMLQRGWTPRAAINFSKKTKSDSFLFVRESRDDVQASICALDLSSSDQLHLIGFSGSLCSSIEQLIIDRWPAGLKRSKTYDNRRGHKFIFKGNPWRAKNGEELLISRLLFLDIIREVYKEGFVLMAAGHPQQSLQDVDTVYFAPMVNPQPVQLFLFGVQGKNCLYIIDSPSECEEIIRRSVQDSWPQGIESDDRIGQMVFFNIIGHPWCTKGHEAINARKMILTILQRLRALGWRVDGTIDATKDVDDASCFLMVECPPVKHRFFAMKLGGSRTIKLIDAPEEIVTTVERTISTTWPGGLERRDEEIFLLSKRFRECLGVLCFILGAVEDLGWTLVSSADLSVKYKDIYEKHPLDLHTLIFEKTR